MRQWGLAMGRMALDGVKTRILASHSKSLSMVTQLWCWATAVPMRLEWTCSAVAPSRSTTYRKVEVAIRRTEGLTAALRMVAPCPSSTTSGARVGSMAATAASS